MQGESHFTLKHRFKGYVELALKRDPSITILVFETESAKVYIPLDFNFTSEEWEEMEALEIAETPGHVD